MAKIYAVRVGRKKGLFNSWDECQNSIKGYSGAEFKSFKEKRDALEYLGESFEEEDSLTLSDEVKDEVKWLLEQIIEQAWCGQAQLVENYAHNISDALEIKINNQK